MYWIVRDINAVVTKHSYDIISQAAAKVSDKVVNIDGLSDLKGDRLSDVVVVGTVVNAIKVLLRGYKHVAVWFQGVLPEESYMRNKKLFRKIIMGIAEKYVLKHTDILIFLSHAMKDHYEEKYSLKFKDNWMIMPCFNTEIQKSSFSTPNKYDNNVFVYAGGLSIWQCFDKTLACYEEIEKLKLPNSKLIILTRDKNTALEKIKNTNIKNYLIDHVRPDELHKVLDIAKYGFIIRDDVIVNRVATPTKLSTYIANGLIPIYSPCIRDFHQMMKEFRFKLTYDEYFIDNLRSMAKEEVDPKDVLSEYETIYTEYYNTDLYVKRISNIFKEYFN